MGIKKTLKNILQNKAVFAVLAVGLVIAGFTIDVPIHPIVEKIFGFEIVKFALLSAIVYLGSVSIEAGLLLAIIYIMITEKIDDAQIKSVVEVAKPVVKTVEKTEEPKE